MKSLSKILVTLSAGVLLSSPLAGFVHSNKVAQAIEVSQSEKQSLAALGGSLDAQQTQETLQLLGAGNLDQNSIKHIDGSIINQYLNDGSDASTVVFSSAFIQEMPEGYGVKVQIVTPQNILNVSQMTYQNAAITAGAKNAQIRVATVEPVTGEGALAGVYALLAESGVQINSQDVAAAQREINLVNELEKDTGLSNTKVNQALAQLKTRITNSIIAKEDLNEENINNIINEVIQENNIDVEAHPEILEKLKEYANQYAVTDAASNEDTIKQLEQSTIPVWGDVLSQLTGLTTMEEFEARPALDFSDREGLMPEINALKDKFYADIEQLIPALSNYSYSFVLETMNPEMSNVDKQALNDLRTEMFYYASAEESQFAAEIGVTSNLQDRWMNQLATFENLKVSEPILAEIYTQLGIQTGLAAQTLYYRVVGQEGSVISFEIVEDRPDHVNTYRYEYDLSTGQVTDAVTAQPLQPVDYTSAFGNPLQDNRTDIVPIPADYIVPEEYIVVFETDESEESSEESTEESDESLAEDTQEESIIEETLEEIQEETVAEEPIIEELPEEEVTEAVIE